MPQVTNRVTKHTSSHPQRQRPQPHPTLASPDPVVGTIPRQFRSNEREHAKTKTWWYATSTRGVTGASHDFTSPPHSLHLGPVRSDGCPHLRTAPLSLAVWPVPTTSLGHLTCSEAISSPWGTRHTTTDEIQYPSWTDQSSFRWSGPRTTGAGHIARSHAFPSPRIPRHHEIRPGGKSPHDQGPHCATTGRAPGQRRVTCVLPYLEQAASGRDLFCFPGNGSGKKGVTNPQTIEWAKVLPLPRSTMPKSPCGPSAPKSRTSLSS